MHFFMGLLAVTAASAVRQGGPPLLLSSQNPRRRSLHLSRNVLPSDRAGERCSSEHGNTKVAAAATRDALGGRAVLSISRDRTKGGLTRARRPLRPIGHRQALQSSIGRR